MKKKTLLTALVAAVAITAYSVSGTYAKYISKVDLTDAARVAKWGFTLKDTTGNYDSGLHTVDLFNESYTKMLTLNGKTEKYTMVESLAQNKDNVVAPGTTGTYEFELEGEMETRYILKFEVSADAKDIVVYYGKDADGKVLVAKDAADLAGKIQGEAKEYRPVTYTVLYNRTGDFSKDASGNFVDAKTIVVGTDVNTATLQNTLNQHVKNHPEGFNPGVLDQHYQVNWQWKTEQEATADMSVEDWNAVDTWLGKNLTANDKIVFGVKVIAEQVAEDFAK